MLPVSSDPGPEQTGQPVDFVIMGNAEAVGPGLDDILMVAHLDAARDRLYLISLPMPGGISRAATGSGAMGGPQATVSLVQDLLGIHVDHAVMVDLEGILGMCELMGGVDVRNRLASSDLGFAFPQGDLHLEGEELLAYAGQSEGLPNGDLDRAERQRLVLKALLGKAAKPQVLANPVTFARLTGQLGQYLTVDHRLTDAAIWQLVSSLRIAGGDDVVTLQAPVPGLTRSLGGAATDEPAAELGAALRDDAMAQYVAKHGLADEG
jgi:LCP family protein required for cell wall assembly